ncbi:MAG: NUDIX hydrolase [Vicinamibacterales bacterium]
MTTPPVPHHVRPIFQGRIFNVVVESVTLPRGEQLDVELVRHPGSVVIIPVTDAGEIILVRQYRHAIARWVWELPAGCLKPGEDPEQAASRECHEEIGLVPGHVQSVGAFFPSPGYCDEEMHIFKATALRQPRSDETARPDDDEDIEPQAFPPAAIRRMIAAGEIIDLKTVAGLSLL